MSTPTHVPRSQQWITNTAARRARLREQGGGPFYALLDGDYSRKVEQLLEWRAKAWQKNHGRPITKVDLLKLMIDADLAQVTRRQRVTARRNGREDARPTSSAQPKAARR